MAKTCSFSYQLDLVNQFATKYSRILVWILTLHTQHACFELFSMEFCTHASTVVPRPFLTTGNGLGTRQLWSWLSYSVARKQTSIIYSSWQKTLHPWTSYPVHIHESQVHSLPTPVIHMFLSLPSSLSPLYIKILFSVHGGLYIRPLQYDS